MGAAGDDDARMAGADDDTRYRFYGELAEWWPLISPPGEYAEEAAFAATLLDSAAIPVTEVLELGSGGGHNAVHLAERYDMTLVDLSDEMLAVSRRINPGCEHVVGDMRSVRLHRLFDAVFVHDAVAYMTTADDLAAVAETTFVHCRPGGVAVFVPDDTTERFEPDADIGGSDADDGRGVRYLEWTWAPEPDGTTTITEYVFMLRDIDGAVRVEHEQHTTGLFDRDTWVRVVGAAGFEVEVVEEVTSEERTPRLCFVGQRVMS